MKYLKRFFKNSNNYKIKLLYSLIDNEISESDRKFGYKVDTNIIELEKKVFIEVILPYWDDIKNAGDSEYQRLLNLVFKEVESKLPIEELFYKGDKQYKLHIANVIYKIFLTINNL